MIDPCDTFLPLGSAVEVPKCAKSVVLPADFMTTGGAAPLGAADEPEKKSNLGWWLLAVAAVGGAAWWFSRGASVLANPKASVVWPTGAEWWRIVSGYEELIKRLDFQIEKQDPKSYVSAEWNGRQRWARIYQQSPTCPRSELYFVDKTTGNYYRAESCRSKSIVGNVKDLVEPLNENPHCVRARHLHNPGRAKKLGLTPSDFDPRELARGTKHELEHTDSERVARQIAMDHLSEDEGYYEKLDAMERGTFRTNPVDAGPPYTIEELNTLIGTRVHRKASPHSTLESATESATLQASRTRRFLTINILDRRGNVVATFQGVH